MTFTIIGPPRTKKNHARIIKVRGVPRIIQSAQSCAWEESAILQLRTQWPKVRRVVDGPFRYTAVGGMENEINLCASIYRDRNVGDLGNYLASVCDALERAGIVADDKLIQGFDGSRLYVDRKNPRCEISLTPLVG